jgi:hypothetical protein
MRFLSIRLETRETHEVGFRRAINRLLALPLAGPAERRVALVSGADRGLGLEISRQLAHSSRPHGLAG